MPQLMLAAPVGPIGIRIETPGQPPQGCPICLGALDLIQPRIDVPGELIGSCLDCDRQFWIASVSPEDWEVAVAFALPDLGAIRQAG